MTYKQWFIATGSKFNMSEVDVDLILVNQGIEDLANETVDVVKAKTALVKEFGSVIPMANVSEGGYSVSWNMDALKIWYKSACEDLGIVPVTSARVRNSSNRW